MRKVITGCLSAIIVSVALLGGVTAAQAATTTGSSNCTATKTLGTTSVSGLGYVYHDQFDRATGILWKKNWVNPSGSTTRYYNKGLQAVDWKIQADENISSTGSCTT